MASAAERKRQEERIKLFATAFSNLGVASLVTGVISPLVSAHAQVVVTVIAVAGGVVLHLIGQGVLHFVVPSEEPRE